MKTMMMTAAVLAMLAGPAFAEQGDNSDAMTAREMARQEAKQDVKNYARSYSRTPEGQKLRSLTTAYKRAAIAAARGNASALPEFDARYGMEYRYLQRRYEGGLEAAARGNISATSRTDRNDNQKSGAGGSTTGGARGFDGRADPFGGR